MIIGIITLMLGLIGLIASPFAMAESQTDDEFAISVVCFLLCLALSFIGVVLWVYNV